ncbi:uncharacterized protein LOC129761141 [Toxorhynchites rutilus septentrionalis]|uniref:uncharacterized protein LOC129761141 n=1 Tax=Toxorhynchites rutilus septentrionalis TaxID=329112 RepID=UPI00247884AA|nr:uncharacterized protein LOC129761141 [Toxorhynchites rutilus septentrionalis]
MANRRLVTYLTENKELDCRQFAFRPGMGTNTYFASLGEVVAEAGKNRQHLEMVALDLEKAYNRTWIPLVLKTLADWGVDGNLLHFVQNFATNRTFEVKVGYTSSRRFHEETGVPQGSVLAVTLFLIAMNSLFRVIPKGVCVFTYADDILLVVVGNTHRAPRIKIQEATNAIGKWAVERGFRLSAQKSGHMVVCSHKHQGCNSGVKIYNDRIPRRRTLRILGVVVDCNLNFQHHFDEVKKSCATRLNLLKTISKPHRSNNRTIRLRVAKAIINSRLTYGLEVTCLARDKLLKTLSPIYNNALRIISGLLPSTPAASVCAEIGEPPFDIFVDAAIVSRTASFLAKTSGGKETHLTVLTNEILQQVTHSNLPSIAKQLWFGTNDWRLPVVQVDDTIRNNFRAGASSVGLEQTFVELVSRKYHNYEIRYTDGSKGMQGVGFGVSGHNNSLISSKKLVDICQVFSAEAAGIFEAATIPSSKSILIVTDSASVIDAVGAAITRRPWIQAIRRYLLPDTVLMWVPGHSGIAGNEAADRFAGIGHLGQLLTRKVPLDDIRLWIANTFKTFWAEKWSVEATLFLRRIKGSITSFEDVKTMREQRILSRLRTGHCNMSHNFNRGPFHPLCDLCEVRNSVEHILCICPKYENLRNSHGISGSIRDVLGDDPSQTTALLCFLKDADLYFKI